MLTFFVKYTVISNPRPPAAIPRETPSRMLAPHGNVLAPSAVAQKRGGSAISAMVHSYDIWFQERGVTHKKQVTVHSVSFWRTLETLATYVCCSTISTE